MAKAAHGLAAFATCLAGSVAGMAVATQVNHDPSSQPAMLALVLPAAVGLALVTGRPRRSYRRGAHQRRPGGADRRRGRGIEAEPA